MTCSVIQNNKTVYEAFQAICDILDKVGAMSTEIICDNCKIVSVTDTEYREIYISLNNLLDHNFVIDVMMPTYIIVIVLLL